MNLNMYGLLTFLVTLIPPMNCRRCCSKWNHTRNSLQDRFQFGVAIGASYGAFKLSLLDVNLGAIGLLMIANLKNLKANQFVVGFLYVIGAISMIAV